MKIILFIFLFSFSIWVYAQSESKNSFSFYKIKEGENLSTILFDKGLSPLWGKNGFVNKAIELNKNNIYDNGNLIFANTKIIIPYKEGYNPDAKNREIASSGPSEDQEDFARYGKVHFISWIGFSKISGTDTNTQAQGEVFSGLNKGLSLEWEQIWSKNITTALFVDFQEQLYQENPNRVLENEKINLTNFGLKINYYFNSSFFNINKISYGESLYLYAPSSSSLRFDTANNLKIDSSINYRLAELDPFSITASLGLKGTAAADIEDYKSKNGFGYFSQISIDQKYKNKNLHGSISYEKMNNDTTAFEQSHEHLKFHFSISWELR